jgi:hypothetical protein
MDLDKDLIKLLKETQTLGTFKRLDELTEFLKTELDKTRHSIRKELNCYCEKLRDWDDRGYKLNFWDNRGYQLNFLEDDDYDYDYDYLTWEEDNVSVLIFTISASDSYEILYKIKWTKHPHCADCDISITSVLRDDYRFIVDLKEHDIYSSYGACTGWTGPQKVVFHIAEFLTKHGQLIHGYAGDLRHEPILENRQKIITVLCIYHFRESDLNVFPKDLIRLICERIMKD